MGLAALINRAWELIEGRVKMIGLEIEIRRPTYTLDWLMNGQGIATPSRQTSSIQIVIMSCQRQ